MSVVHYLDNLHARKQELDKKIQLAYAKHYPDSEISQMKREKLGLKDRMEYMRMRKKETEPA